MNSQFHSISTAPQPAGKGNAILVDGELVDTLMTTIKADSNPVDYPPTKRELLNLVVSQMSEYLLLCPVYYKKERDVNKVYKWFDSEVASAISSYDMIRDKGRFVEACIIAYLKGEQGVRDYCVSAKRIRPRVMSQQEISKVVKAASEMDDVKDVESSFVPATHLGEI